MPVHQTGELETAHQRHRNHFIRVRSRTAIYREQIWQRTAEASCVPWNPNTSWLWPEPWERSTSKLDFPIPWQCLAC
jgi:hypothetical protein